MTQLESLQAQIEEMKVMLKVINLMNDCTRENLDRQKRQSLGLDSQGGHDLGDAA